MSEEESSYSEGSYVPARSTQRSLPQPQHQSQPQQGQFPTYPSPPPQGFYYQLPQGAAIHYTTPIPSQQPMYVQQPQTMTMYQSDLQPEQKRRHHKDKPKKEKPKPHFLTRGQRRFIFSGFQKDQLAVMRLGKKSTFGNSKEQLVKSAVEITSSRDDVIDLILSACDANEED